MTRDCEVVEAQPRTPEVREVLLSNTPAWKTFLIIKKSGKASSNEMARLQSEERGQQESVRRKIVFNRQHFFPEYKQGSSVIRKSPLKHLFYYNVRDVIALAETGISSE